MTTITTVNPFKDNLAAITGDGALCKLDVVDPKHGMARIRLAQVYGFERDRFDAALFIYICNVLDEYGLASKYPMGRKVIIAVTAKLVVEWFNGAKLLLDNDLPLDIHLVNNVGPDWMEEGKMLDRKTIKAIEKDMDRVFSVWYECMFNF